MLISDIEKQLKEINPHLTCTYEGMTFAIWYKKTLIYFFSESLFKSITRNGEHSIRNYLGYLKQNYSERD